MSQPIRIGYVPEHYLLPLHLSKPYFSFPVELIPFPSGTGHMITSLRSNEIDLAIGLTEGWVAGLLTGQSQTQTEQKKPKGYSIVGSWVQNPLRWSIVTGRNRDTIQNVSDLSSPDRTTKVGVSRLGSGSYVMAFVLAQQEGWLEGKDNTTTTTTITNNDSNEKKRTELEFVVLGPFGDLRDGVTGFDGKEDAKADFFMWEHFTTKPYFHDQGTSSGSASTSTSPPLKWIGEIYTPWPSWHVAASSKTFPDPKNDEKLARIFEAFDRGVAAFNADTNEAVRMLGTGEAGCHYNEEDAREWLKSVSFFEKTRGVDLGVMDGVVKVLKAAGVIEPGVEIDSDGDDGVVGIRRG